MSIVKRTTTWLAVMVAAATMTTIAAASPSSASVIVPTNATAYGPNGGYGYAFYNADTNVLSIHDSHADGYGIAVINWRTDLAKQGPYFGWNRDGNGTTVYYYLHMPPGTRIKFYLCAEQDGLAIGTKCGQTVTGYAGGANA
ncbi:MAG: hypothetical protein ACRDOI_26835 [Trebonia sp.]